MPLRHAKGELLLFYLTSAIRDLTMEILIKGKKSISVPI
jgi:hypothetical protein